VLYERRGTPVLRSARPELVVPKPWTSWRWTEALNSRLWPRACAATGKRASMRQSRVPRFPAAFLEGQKLGDSDQIRNPINHGNLVGKFSSGICDRWLGVHESRS